MFNTEFANPEILWLLILAPLAFLLGLYRINKKTPKLNFNFNSSVGNAFKANALLRFVPLTIRVLALSVFVFALARPQSSSSWQNVNTEGIDIVIALDISGSMLAEDFKPNRLEASKNVAANFIKNRPNDRIGLVVYSGESFTQCPLTTDHSVLVNLFAEIKNGMIEDGTAIGMGLATAVNRLKESDAKSKVVILLTDGYNTAGEIPPITAAEIAKKFGVRVYTIGVGTNGYAPYPFKTQFGGTIYQDVEVKIDEETLKSIASTTGANYFRATDNKSLEEIYAEIDLLEKSKINVTEFKKRKEEFLPWLLLGFSLLLLEYLLRITTFKSLTGI